MIVVVVAQWIWDTLFYTMNEYEYKWIKRLQLSIFYLAELDDSDEMKAGEDDIQKEYNTLVSLLERAYKKDIKTLIWEYEEILGR